MIPITKILCPTDFSEPSYKGLDAANELAKHFNAEIILIHILPPVFICPRGVSMAFFLKGNCEDDVKRDKMASKSLSMILAEKIPESIKSRSILVKGIPSDEIVRNAKEEKVDIIVIGTHGFTKWRHLMVGSVVEKVFRLASCPVLTISAYKTPTIM